MPLFIPSEFFDVETAVYGRDYLRFVQSADAIARFHALLEKNYPALRCTVYCNSHSRLICYELPDMQINGERVAYFGFWESQNDKESACAIFDKCAAELKVAGVVRLIGPINFSTFFDYRIRLNHFERLNYPGEPYNMPYYSRLLEECGFRLLERYFSIHTDSVTEPLARLRKKAKRVLERDQPFVIVSLRQVDLEKYLSRIGRLIELSFRDALAYVPMTKNLFELMTSPSALGKYCKSSSCVAFLNGEPVGLVLSLPDWAELDAATKSQLIAQEGALDADQLGERLLKRRAYLKTICVAPELQSSGLYAHLFHYFLHSCQALYNESGGALMRLDNAASKLATWLFEGGNSTRIEYGLYAKAIE